jgi:hypothetical protein
MSEIKLKARRGKPRRAESVAKRTQIRIDEESKRILQREFGSLGNALFFLRQGIEKTKEKHNIPTANPAPEPPALNRRDLELILKALKRFYDDCGGGPGVGRGNGGGRTRVQIEGIVAKISEAVLSHEELSQ